MDTIEIRHTGPKGSDYGWVKHHCRCPECVACHEHWLEQRRQRTGATKRVLPDFEHGTLGRYDSPRFKCRCDLCRGANAARKRSYTGSEPRVKHDQVVVPREPKQERQEKKDRGTPVLKLHGGIAPSDRTFEMTPAIDCGEELSLGHYCRRLWPCKVHGE